MIRFTFTLVVSIAATSITGCIEEPKTPLTGQQIKTMIEESNLRVPPNNRVVASGVLPRYRWLVINSKKLTFIEKERCNSISGKTVLGAIQNFVEKEDIGLIPDESFGTVCIWHNGPNAYHATQIQTSKGFFLLLERYQNE